MKRRAWENNIILIISISLFKTSQYAKYVSLDLWDQELNSAITLRNCKHFSRTPFSVADICYFWDQSLQK